MGNGEQKGSGGSTLWGEGTKRRYVLQGTGSRGSWGRAEEWKREVSTERFSFLTLGERVSELENWS